MLSVLEVQKELRHPKMARKVSGLLRNGPLGTNARNRQDTILNRSASYGLGAKVNS